MFTKMLKTMTAATLALSVLVAPAYARTYNYACQVKNEKGDATLYSAKLDTIKKTITWRGTVYKNIKATYGEACEAKACFENEKIGLYTATQGAATLSVKPGNEEYDCDLVR
jgi:hypothetical protein